MLQDLMLIKRKSATASDSAHRIVKLMVEADAKRQVACAERPEAVERVFHCSEVFRARALGRHKSNLQFDRAPRLKDFGKLKVHKRAGDRHDPLRYLVGFHDDAAVHSTQSTHH